MADQKQPQPPDQKQPAQPPPASEQGERTRQGQGGQGGQQPPPAQTDDPVQAQQQAAQQPRTVGATSPTQTVLPYGAQTGGKGGGTLVSSDQRGLPGDPAVKPQVATQVPSQGVDAGHPMGRPAHLPSIDQVSAVHVVTPEQVKLEASGRAEWAQIKAGETEATRQAQQAASGQSRTLQASAQAAQEQAEVAAQQAASQAQQTLSQESAQKSAEEAQALAAARSPEAQREGLTGGGKSASVPEQVDTERKEMGQHFKEEAEGDQKLHSLKQEADRAQHMAAGKPGDQRLRADAEKKQKAYQDAVAESKK